MSTTLSLYRRSGWRSIRPWRDGTTHFVFDPLTFIERMAALIPHPREHQFTYHGVLAPASSWRGMIVPTAAAPGVESRGAEVVGDSRPVMTDTVPPAAPSPCPPSSPVLVPHSPYPSRYSWSELMRRVFGIDVLACEHCGGRRRLIALITDT